MTTCSVPASTGSLLCERLSGHTIELGLVPFGSIGLTLFGVDLWWATAAATPHAPIGAMEFMREHVGSAEAQSKNMLIEGENLQAVVTLYKYRGQIDLIVTDQLCNTGQYFR